MLRDTQRTEYPRICIDDHGTEFTELTGGEIDQVSGGRLLPAFNYRTTSYSQRTATTVMEDPLGRPGRFFREER